ncbi:beta strand repeat-containing protein [Desertibaculum subflavum]|uniref:beta strand repeat-containing protein n=1 Tax=Desertibaculum subflavum TaxID=2268458 RepID=UPI0013C41F4F
MIVMPPRLSHALALGCLFAASGAMPAFAIPFTVGSGVTDTANKPVTGTDTGTVEAGGTLSVSGTAITWSGPSAGVTIDNSGTITSGNRGIDTSGANPPRNFTLNNNLGALLSGASDGFRINTDIGNGTVIVNNAGTIRSTVDGQALDFDGNGSATGTVQINNLATGLIQSVGQDALRTGEGAVVNNAGQIVVNTAAPDTNFDGVDMQGRSATVNNLAGGSISGARHGITSDVGLTVTNAAGAAITGRNGSGVGSDGTGTVTNFGTITGAVDGTSLVGDGDGVDIDFAATIINWGIIQGTGAVGGAGSPNASEGIAAGGGSITNHTGALISGANHGILIDDGDGNSAYAATALTNDGTIQGLNGFGVKLVGNFDDTVTNAGVISGTNGLALDLGAGNDTLNLKTGSAITGLADGGVGIDAVRLAGTGNLANTANFEQLKVESGSWTLTGAQSFSQSVTVADGAVMKLAGAQIATGTVQVAQGGAIQAGAGDVLRVGGDFLNRSQQNTIWMTELARLELVGPSDTSHLMLLTGSDLGATKAGLIDNFSWASLLIELGNDLALGAGIDGVDDLALYLGELLGAEIQGDSIANIAGNGFNIYYDPGLAGNAYLAGRNYLLLNGGELIAMTDVPEPSGLLALLVGLGALVLRRRR